METILLFLKASWGHFLSSIFLGLLPVVSISVLLCFLSILTPLVRRNKSIFTVVFLFSVSGSVLGLLLGASREPAVQAFLPALITLLAGVIFYSLPKDDSIQSFEAIILGKENQKNSDPAYKAEYVVFAITALMISSIMGSFWGGSMRSIKELDARKYNEWLIQYEQIQIPGSAQDLGILSKPLEQLSIEIEK